MVEAEKRERERGRREGNLMTFIPSHLRWYLSIKRREVVNESLEIYYSRFVRTPTFGGEGRALVSD